MKRVGIVGGGVAGLMAAWELARLGFSVQLFEAADDLGGLASSFDFDGRRIERFYHFVCRNDRTLIETCGRLGIADRLRWRRTRTGFYHDGRLYRFGSPIDLLRFAPLSLIDKLRFGINILYSHRFTHWQRLEDRPAKQWLTERLGERGYRVVWDPLLRVKFAEYHERVSAAWMWHRIHRVATSRRSLFAPEEFGHFEGGSETLIRKLAGEAEAHGSRLRTRVRVRGLLIDGRRCTGLNVVGPSAQSEAVPFDYVICAVPLPIYCGLLPDNGSEYRRRLEAIPFIGVVCMILRLKQPVSPNFWLNINDARISFNGIIEYSNLTGPEVYDGRSIVYIPFYLEPKRPRYAFSDEALLAEYSEALRVVNPAFGPELIEGYRVFRAPHAQPICEVGFSSVVPSCTTPWQGCYLVESTQLYPGDRVVSGTLRLAQDAVGLILAEEGLRARAEFRPRPPDEIPT